MHDVADTRHRGRAAGGGGGVTSQNVRVAGAGALVLLFLALVRIAVTQPGEVPTTREPVAVPEAVVVGKGAATRIAFISDQHYGENGDLDERSDGLKRAAFADPSLNAVVFAGDMATEVDCDSCAPEATRRCEAKRVKFRGVKPRNDAEAVLANSPCGAVAVAGVPEGLHADVIAGTHDGVVARLIVQRGYLRSFVVDHGGFATRVVLANSLSHEDDWSLYHGYGGLPTREVRRLEDFLRAPTTRPANATVLVVHIPPGAVLDAAWSTASGTFVENVCCTPRHHRGSSAFTRLVRHARGEDGKPLVDVIVSGHDHGNTGVVSIPRDDAQGGHLRFIALRHSGFGGYQKKRTPPGATIVDVSPPREGTAEPVLHVRVMEHRGGEEFATVELASGRDATVDPDVAAQSDCEGLIDYTMQAAGIGLALVLAVAVCLVRRSQVTGQSTLSASDVARRVDVL